MPVEFIVFLSVLYLMIAFSVFGTVNSLKEEFGYSIPSVCGIALLWPVFLIKNLLIIVYCLLIFIVIAFIQTIYTFYFLIGDKKYD